jgi:opacity protein-like surface antigen
MKKVLLLVLLFAASVSAFAQQDYVGRYDSFVGFTYLDTPKMNLMERGFITQEGVNLTRWLAFGADFSMMTGHSDLTVGSLVPADRTAANNAGFPDAFGVPYNSTTCTYTAGPQINYRKFKKVTIFIHPGLGAIHEKVTADPKTLVQNELVAALVPGGTRSDTTYFYGVGGGMQYAVTKHIGLRFTADFVHLHLFSNLLADSRNSLRFGIGPTFNFGKNVKK